MQRIYTLHNATLLLMIGTVFSTTHADELYHKQTPVAVIAHRGASHFAPENTLAAFQHAIELKADWFELDCTLSKEGQVVVIHDQTVDRTTNGIGAVADMTLPELKRLDAGSWKDVEFADERIPVLEEALQLAKGKIGVYIEIKESDDDAALLRKILRTMRNEPIMTPAVAKEVLRMIEEKGSRHLPLARNVIASIRKTAMEKQVRIETFSIVAAAVLRIEAPDLQVVLNGTPCDDTPEEHLQRRLRWIFFLDLAGWQMSERGVNPALVSLMHQSGKTFGVWGVDTPKDIKRLAQLGVDALCTDRPDICLKVLQEMGAHQSKSIFSTP